MDRTIRAFFRWWLSELGSLLPTVVRRALFPTGVAAAVSIDDDEIVLWQMARKEPQELGRVQTGGRAETAVADELRDMVARHHLRRSRAELVFAGGSVLERSVDLPADAADNLKEVLAFEMDRLTPFSPDEVYYDYRVTGSDPDRKSLQVAVAIARRAEVDKATAWAKAADLEPISARPPGRHDEGHAPLNLLLSQARRGQANWLARLALILLALFVVLTAIVVYLPLKEGERHLEAARERIGELSVVASEAADLDRRVSALQQKRSFLANAKSTHRLSIQILDEVTRRLPDSAWLMQWNMRDQQLRIAGYADDPAVLIRLLEQSPTLSNVRFASPVTKDPRMQKDRFNLSADIVSSGQP